jgi:hypothetical protein
MNPLNYTSLLFLGVLVLVCALLFVYFENKAREQNHKISSMLSLVSSLTEEIHSIRRQMQGGGVIKQNTVHYENVDDDVNDDDDDDLVSVSDDDDDEEELDDSCVSDDEDDVDDEDDDDENDIMNTNVIEIGDNVKILTLLQPIELVSDEEDDNTEFDADDVLDVEELDSSDDDKEEQKSTNDDVKIFDLKSIHLEESATIDYKKLSVGKLKTIVAEKGLASDTSKLKKQELLKLLNAE